METSEVLDKLYKILVVDDDETLCKRLARSFERRDYDAQTAFGYEEAVAALDGFCPDLAVIDLRLGDGSGLHLLEELMETAPESEAIMLTGYGSISTAVDATKLGATNFIQKPADVDDILAAFERGTKKPGEAVETEYEAPSLERTEWEHINRVLDDCGGNKSEAARRLGIHRRTLQRKLNRYSPD
jgi:two-component system response regulator RegA